jgi:hypothetical protein
MERAIQKIWSKVDWLTNNPSKLFIMDGSGALLDAFLLGVVLTSFEDVFGMPSSVLYVLSAMALLFAVYSLSCFYFVTRSWRRWLLVVVVANVLHGLLTIGLVVYHFQQLTALGLVFFVLEIFTLGLVVFLEVKGLRKGFMNAA